MREATSATQIKTDANVPINMLISKQKMHKNELSISSSAFTHIERQKKRQVRPIMTLYDTK